MTWLAFISCGLAVLGSSSVLVHGIPTMQMCGMSPTIAVQILSILTIIMTFMGPVIGYINIFISLGAAFASAMTGRLYEVFGGYQIPWLIITGIMVVVTVIRTVCSSKSRHYTANS